MVSVSVGRCSSSWIAYLKAVCSSHVILQPSASVLVRSNCVICLQRLMFLVRCFVRCVLLYSSAVCLGAETGAQCCVRSVFVSALTAQPSGLLCGTGTVGGRVGVPNVGVCSSLVELVAPVVIVVRMGVFPLPRESGEFGSTSRLPTHPCATKGASWVCLYDLKFSRLD